MKIKDQHKQKMIMQTEDNIKRLSLTSLQEKYLLNN